MPHPPNLDNLPNIDCYTCLYQIQLNGRTFQPLTSGTQIPNFEHICLLTNKSAISKCSNYKLGSPLFIDFTNILVSPDQINIKDNNLDRKALYNLAPELLERILNI